MADIVHLARGCDIRPSLTSFSPRGDGGPPLIEYWVRPKGVAPDVAVSADDALDAAQVLALKAQLASEPDEGVKRRMAQRIARLE